MKNDSEIRVRLPAELRAELQKRVDKRDEWDLSKEIRLALKLYVAKAEK